MPKLEFDLVSEAEEGASLKSWFAERYPAVGFGNLQKLLRTGEIRVDGKRAKLGLRLASGQAVRVPPNARTRAMPKTSDKSLHMTNQQMTSLKSWILYQDDHIFVFNKPAGLATQGGTGITRHLDGYLKYLTDKKGNIPRLVHRLDRDTAGLLIVAKTRAAARFLADEFKYRRVRKIYWALVYGSPTRSSGRLSNFVIKTEVDGIETMAYSKRQSKEAQHCVSYYHKNDSAAGMWTWMSLAPVTGRMHQLRLDMQQLGCPIVGDHKYRAEEVEAIPGGQDKLHLLARYIRIAHPDGGHREFSAPLPKHIQQSFAVIGMNPEMQLEDEWLKDPDLA